MDPAVRKLVRDRAGNCCECCRLPHAYGSFFQFHIEHIVARQHGGGDEPDNLALACPECNAFKGPNLAAIDPETGQLTPLFNPRTHNWHDHFVLDDILIVGTTVVGRATVRLLNVNSADQLQLRAELQARGEYPV